MNVHSDVLKISASIVQGAEAQNRARKQRGRQFRRPRIVDGIALLRVPVSSKDRTVCE